jgi:hypothetical protein
MNYTSFMRLRQAPLDQGEPPLEGDPPFDRLLDNVYTLYGDMFFAGSKAGAFE